jgi:hypothetical protein
MFATPKTRRLHLINAHAYPKEYFFAVTNKGIGGLLARWGDGASLLRGPWRSRDTEDDNQGDAAPPSTSSSQQSSSQHPDSEGHAAENGSKGEEPFAPDSPSAPAVAESEAGVDAMAVVDKMSEGGDHGDADRDENGDADVEMLARGVSALDLVPSSIRFGRGGPTRRRAGLTTRGGRPAARHMSHPPHSGHHHHAARNNTDNDKNRDKLMGGSDAMEQGASVMRDKPPPARGRRGRGGAGGDGRGSESRGRGIGRGRGFVPPPPRAGFLARGGAGRGLPRGMIVTGIRARGRGSAVI